MAENIRKVAPMDAPTRFCEDKTVAATGPIQVAAADVIIAVGPGYHEFAWVINITSIEVASGDENYIFILQGTNNASFATAAGNTELARFQAGKGSTFLPAEAIKDIGIGRYVVPANNFKDVVYKNVRLVVVVAGTIATGVVFDSWLSIDT